MSNEKSHQLLHHYDRASKWALSRVAGAEGKLDAATPCDGWDVRTLLNHMLETQRYFVGSARGEEVAPPASTPSDDLVGDDPLRAFEAAREDALQTFGEPGAIDRTGPALGIAFSDQLLHGWDVATATDQDATMPEGLAQAAFDTIHGRFTDEQRTGVFKPEVATAPDASPQERLLAYTGRQPR
jgi:uncharacterized protein (TIGR03086 family)